MLSGYCFAGRGWQCRCWLQLLALVVGSAGDAGDGSIALLQSNLLARQGPVAAVVLRGDTFRGLSASIEPGSPCSGDPGTLRRQEQSLRSIDEQFVHPLRKAGFQVLILGSIYECPQNNLIEAHFARSPEVLSVELAQISRNGSTQPNTAADALWRSVTLHPEATLHVLLRGDLTYTLPIPTSAVLSAENKSVFFAEGDIRSRYAADQVHVAKKEAAEDFIRVLRGHRPAQHLHFLHHYLRKSRPDIRLASLWPELLLNGNSAARNCSAVAAMDCQGAFVDCNRLGREHFPVCSQGEQRWGI